MIDRQTANLILTDANVSLGFNVHRIAFETALIKLQKQRYHHAQFQFGYEHALEDIVKAVLDELELEPLNA